MSFLLTQEFSVRTPRQCNQRSEILCCSCLCFYRTFDKPWLTLLTMQLFSPQKDLLKDLNYTPIFFNILRTYEYCTTYEKVWVTNKMKGECVESSSPGAQNLASNLFSVSFQTEPSSPFIAWHSWWSGSSKSLPTTQQKVFWLKSYCMWQRNYLRDCTNPIPVKQSILS